MPHVIILAAGKGSRMRSDLPKVLHPVDGVPMIERVLGVAEEIAPRPIVVVGHRACDVMKAVGDRDYVLQTEQRGTGHAVRCALDAFPIHEGDVIVMPGDHPFVTAASIRRLIAARKAREAAVALAVAQLPDFEGPRAQFSDCGRIVRGPDGAIAGIVERKEATAEQARVSEVNVSYYCFRAGWLKENIAAIVSDDTAGECYLTDLVAAAVAQGERVAAVALDDFREGMGVNTPEQLETAAAFA